MSIRMIVGSGAACRLGMLFVLQKFAVELTEPRLMAGEVTGQHKQPWYRRNATTGKPSRY